MRLKKRIDIEIYDEGNNISSRIDERMESAKKAVEAAEEIAEKYRHARIKIIIGGK